MDVVASEDVVTNAPIIYCIHVEGNTIRKDRMLKRFQQLQLNVKMWTASTPQNVKRMLLSKEIRFRDCWEEYDFDDRIKACSLSHYRLWCHMIDTNMEYCLILEDDVAFRQDFIQIVHNFPHRNISLGFPHRNTNTTTSPSEDDVKLDALFLNLYDSLDVREKWIKIDNNLLAGAYILTQKGAQWLIKKYSSQGLEPADHMTRSLQSEGHCWGYFPFLVIQDGFDTTLQSNEHREEDNRKLNEILKDANFSKDHYIF
jgi:GR25 family glycosyltransferase involved in LPS biosynthesis